MCILIRYNETKFIAFQRKNQHMNMIKILFICHGSILKTPGKTSKISGFTKQKGAYYTTTTPFLKAP